MTEWVYGKHAVFHLLAAGRRKAIRIHLQRDGEGSESGLVRLVQEKRVPIALEGTGFFTKRLGSQANHQGIAAEAEGYPFVELGSLLTGQFILILDEIKDPQNLGALCRSALAFGVDGVVIPETHSADIGPGSCQAAAGAVEYLRIAKASSLAKAIEILKENSFWIYGAAMEGDKGLYEEEFPQKVVLVIGSEERGLRRLVRERCDLLLKIPMERPEIGSLNASVAAGVFLYEVMRQKMKKIKEKD